MRLRWLVLFMILGLAAYFIYSKTESVWDNLVFINQSGKFSNVDSLLNKLIKHHPDSLISDLNSNAKSWPISLLTDHIFDSVGGQLNIDETYFKSILADSTGYQFKFLKMMFTNRLSDTLSEQEKELIVKDITNGKINLDSVYTLYMEEWAGTDSIAIRFFEKK